MAIDIFAPSAGQAGSGVNVPGAAAAAGQTIAGGSPETDYKALYEELNTKMGTMGNELGDYRKFFTQIAPILEKLDTQPELLKAISEGKVDAALAKAALEGKITISDATAVTQAHNQATEELGKGATPEQVTQLMEEKLGIFKNEITNSMNEKDELRSFEDKSAAFIASKSDFTKYADDITQWLNEHPNDDDIATAYYAVKGQILEKAQLDGDEDKIAEIAKTFAMNASGAGASGQGGMSNDDLADILVAKRSDPNQL